jgi:cytochrome P450
MNAVTVSPATPMPSHVPESVVYDFDAYRDPGLLANAVKRIGEIVREAPPIFWTPRNGGHWVIQGYEPLFKAYRDPETFSSQMAMSPQQREAIMARLPPGAGRIPQARPINLDPPEHTKYRTPLQRTFSPKSALALKDDIRKLANELIDDVLQQGHCDFVPAVAEQLPVQVFLKLFGLPLEHQAEYRALAKDHLSNAVMDPIAGLGKQFRLLDVMRETLLDRREQPRDDIISMLWKAGVDGRPTTMEDMEDYAVLLFIAGLDTVVNGASFLMLHLAQDFALQEQLRANPKIIPEAVEEMLRRYTFTVPVRFVAKDVVYEGVTMKAGERVLMFDPGADLDPKQFKNPETFDLKREEKTHIAFGAGPHRCLGSHLARVELQIITEQMMSRLPQFRLDPQKTPTFHGGHVIGPASVSLVWDAVN